MELNRVSAIVALYLLLIAVSAAASSFISGGVFESETRSSGRNLLQAKKSCPVNFEFMNYSTITTRCKGPKFPADQCCSALKDFACPYAEQINDLTTDCASTMFSYINLYGSYPPGLFASECTEGKEGLACPAQPPSTSANLSGSPLRSPPSTLLMVVTTVFLALAKFL